MLKRKNAIKCPQKKCTKVNESAMQTLRKKTSPLKYKNETSRFLGEGVSFKAKLIGILEVSEARGDRMCQDALSDLKMAIRAAGEHKQRITINIAIDGLRLRDEKTGDSLYHHPVHKISFIAQDMTDSRAFGYIFGSPDTGHRFFGIKTDKAASQVVIAMRDLFQVVFALKKKEMELAKQHLDKNRYGTSGLFSDGLISKTSTAETTKVSETESKTSTSASSEARPTPAVADLVDLELELNSLQQGLTQMERITPSDPFGSKDDPFGDSFIMYPQKKVILPPPPSGRERASRVSESGSLFSPKTPHTGDTTSAGGDSSIFNMNADFSSFSNDFNSSRDEPSSGDWFSSPKSNSIFEETSTLVPEAPKDQHEITKQEILSQFDVFTELDPLGLDNGTGKSKPYVDKKHFFQELKNPPKKVLNDLVSESLQPQEQPVFTTNFEPKLNNLNASSNSNSANIFTTDPFGEDPFDKTDPFADFTQKQDDPFENDFEATTTTTKIPPPSKIEPIYTTLSKSPKSSSSILEKQASLAFPGAKNVQFLKQNTFDVQFDDFGGKLSQMHENPSLDMSSETECAPEPPPRPLSNLTAIKPPPLPPKKVGESKPPPRPPHTEDSHYDYMDNYETGSNSFNIATTTTTSDLIRNLEKSPPLPVPARKSKFESDFTTVPERPKKQFNLQSTDDDYLTPINIPPVNSNSKKDTPPIIGGTGGPLLLPPPQRSARKMQQLQQQQQQQQQLNSQNMAQVTVASFLDSKPNITTSVATEKLNSSLEGLDITLSQLTLSGLNELAAKLNIPASQLSNMTLVQLTNYLSNFIKNSTTTATTTNSSSSPLTINDNPKTLINDNNSMESSTAESFKADFAANFNNFNSNASSNEQTYDRYAVFRELLQEEIKQTKIDTEPEEIAEEQQKQKEEAEIKVQNNITPSVEVDEVINIKPIIQNTNEPPNTDNSNNSNGVVDKYAALREIVEFEIKHIEQKMEKDGMDNANNENENDNENDECELENDEEQINGNGNNVVEQIEKKTNLINSEKTFIMVNDNKKEILSAIKDGACEIEYNSNIDLTASCKKKEVKATTPISAANALINKSPVNIPKSPVGDSGTDVQNNAQLNSGSLSDVISGSSPEVDNTGSSEVAKKNDAAGESWAIFDQPNLAQDSVGGGKEKQKIPSEEGISPWSSDSKEFGNGSPPEWRHRGDSGSGGDQWSKRSGGRRDQDGWWDTSAEPEVQYYPANRRSTDSYEEEYYECYDRPRRRRNWSSGHGQAAGGHSSSSRDVSPWEEEPRRREHRDHREGRQTWSSRHSRQHSFERHRDRRHTDSWDDDDDYEYEEEHPAPGPGSRFHYPDRHTDRERERERDRDRDRDRHSGGSREMDSDRWGDEWTDDRRHRRRRETDRERWCCPDWEQGEGDSKPISRYSSRWSNPDSTSGKWRDRKHDDRYYSRDSQESPWEDDFSNDPDDTHSSHYLSAKRNWKRPSSASEMDRKKGEMKTRQGGSGGGGGSYHFGTGGSDGERDRRYKSARRSKSRDSQFSDSSHRHKPDPGLTLRGPHRGKQHQHQHQKPPPPPQFENDFIQDNVKKVDQLKVDLSNKKPSTLSRKKPKESPKTEEIVVSTFPRKGTTRAQSMFENDFVSSEVESPIPNRVNARFNFENDFETSEAESPTVQKPSSTKNTTTTRPSGRFEGKSRFQTTQKSMFEDDFSPTEKVESDEPGISSIKEEAATNEEDDSFNSDNFDRAMNRKKILASKNRLSGGKDLNLITKSESVNIFARENDPFDDDFFCGKDNHMLPPMKDKVSPRTELKWTEEFRDFQEEK